VFLVKALVTGVVKGIGKGVAKLTAEEVSEQLVAKGIAKQGVKEGVLESGVKLSTKKSIEKLAVKGAGRSPIFADTNLLVKAAERGHVAALAKIRAGLTYITPNQFREFLNVANTVQAAARRAFLRREGIQIFGGQKAKQLAQSTIFQKVFQKVLAAGHGRGDAALAAFARATGYSAVTMEKRIFNFLTQTLRQLNVPIQRIR